MGEITPISEACATPLDESCDGEPGCTGSLDWVKSAGDNGYQDGMSVAVDATGAAIIAGSFQGAIDFGGNALSSAGVIDIFVAKLDPAGNHLWSRRFGDAENQMISDVAVDISGNVLLTGGFSGKLDFGGGALTSSGNTDAFLAKLDSTGKYAWAKQFIGTIEVRSMAVDQAGDVLLTGFCAGMVDFGEGGVQCQNDQDVFVVKLDAVGNHAWTKVFPSAGTQVGADIAMNSAGEALFTGFFQNSIDFGGGPLTSAGGFDVFVASLDSSGNYLGGKGFGGIGNQLGTSIAVDGSNGYVVVGAFTNSVNFGAGSLTSTGGNDLFIVKFGAIGTALWSKRFGDGNEQASAGVAVDGADNILWTGVFSGSVNFGGSGLTSVGPVDMFAAKFDSTGNTLWNRRLGTASDQGSVAVAADGAGNVFLGGSFADTLDVGSGPIPSNGLDDIFIAKLHP